MSIEIRTAEVLERTALEVAVLASKLYGTKESANEGFYATNDIHMIVNEARELAMAIRMAGISRMRAEADEIKSKAEGESMQADLPSVSINIMNDATAEEVQAIINDLISQIASGRYRAV